MFCSSHVDQLNAYFTDSKWSPDSEFMKVRLVNGANCTSIGDALRFVDQLHVIKSDCVVLTGDIVTNMNLKSAVDLHIERRKTDSSSIMTIVR